MARNNQRGGRNNNPSGRNQYSSDWMDSVRERPIASAAAAAAAAALAIGRSRTVPIQSLLYWLRPLGLLFRPPR